MKPRRMLSFPLGVLLAGVLASACGGKKTDLPDADGLEDGSDDADGTDAGDPGPSEDDGGFFDADHAGSDDGEFDAGEIGDGDAAGDLGGDATDGEQEDGGSDGAGDEGGDGGGGLRGCIRGVFQPYFGNLHSHSTMSDGDGSPEEAFTHARDQAHLDIMVLTDHMEQLFWPLDDWEVCHQVADSFYAPGSYLGDCGFEFATALFGLTGHNNVYFSENLFSLSADFENFYAQLAACAGCIGQFNHPGDSAGHTWKNFQYDAAADEKLNLMEFNTDADPWVFFFQALDAGWHVSPTYNQDNHGTDWGTKNDRRSGFFMTDLSREALYDAMSSRRSFMTFDKNASISMLAEGECWMGSILSGLRQLHLRVEAVDADAADGFASIELFGPGAAPVGSLDCAGANPCVFEFDVPVSTPIYVVARATQADGDWLVSAPVWASP